MIQSIFIKNFKAFQRATLPLERHNILIGENDSGKTSILQAMDIFFNQEKIDKSFVIDSREPVEIGILVDRRFYKKIYRGATFKPMPEEFVGDMSEIEHLKYIYIPMNSYDPKNLIYDLAIARAKSITTAEQLNVLRSISQSAIEQVVSSIDNELLVINGEATEISVAESFKYESALKFVVQSGGVPIESRGSGFQKNLMYALLVGNTYDNVIVGIDEVENSFSINNCSTLISMIQSKIGQTIMTTHSRKVLEVRGQANITPLFGSDGNTATLASLLASLDNTNEKKYLVVEGKFDIPWFEKILSILNKLGSYILVPGGGDGNATTLCESLERAGKSSITIKDGDTNEPNSLQRECAELYTPLEVINLEFGLNLVEVPQNKIDFFNACVIENVRSDDSVKRIISSKVCDFLNAENPIVHEVDMILREFEDNQ